MECTSLLFLIVLGAEAFYDIKNKNLKSRLCRICLVLTIAALAIEAESYAFDGNLAMRGLTFVCNMLSFAMGSLIITVFMFYVTACINEKKPVKYTHAKIVLALGIIESLIAIVGAFLGKTFTYVDACYESGPWIDFLSTFQMVFIIYLFVYILANARILGRHDTIVFLIYVGFTIATTVMEIIFEDLPSFYFVGQAIAMNMIYAESRVRLRLDLESEKKQNALLNGLARDYHTVWLVDKDHHMHLYSSAGKNTIHSAVQLGLNLNNYDDFMNAYVEKYVAESDRERVLKEASLKSIEEKTPEDGIYTVTYRRLNEDGQTDYHRVCFARAVGSDGEMNYILASRSADEEVRKEKEQQRELEEAYAMAQSSNRAKTTFLNNMSHDIRTPMNAIIGYTGLAASHIDNKELVQDYLTKIGQSSDHLLSLINDVLDMSRIESGKMNLEEKKENLSEIIHTLRNIVQADISSHQIEFYIDTIDVNDENIVCDKLRLNQVLLNILSNSIKYTRPGGTVSLRIKEKGVTESGYGQYEFKVKDNGIGMSKEFLETIFDPFTRVKSSTVSGIQGTGLGMAITKNIVDMMGGTIDIVSEENKGTEVTLEFSFKLSDAPRSIERIDALEGLRGMVVDDDGDAAVSAYKMLKEVGMRAEWCLSGKDAILRTKVAKSEGDLFRVYIIDWLMPGMNGVETARQIRRIVGDEVPIVILSAYDWSDIEQEAREAGVTAFISKPLFPSDLMSVLEKCCGMEQAEAVPERAEISFDGRKVLLVEDNEMNREIAREILEESGFVVDTAEDGTYAVEKMKNASEGQYDLVLMDIQMPIMDGYEATRQIRALKSSVSSIPIIAMTANAFAEDREKALEAGMNDHLAKPIDIPKLLEMLKKYLS